MVWFPWKYVEKEKMPVLLHTKEVIVAHVTMVSLSISIPIWDAEVHGHVQLNRFRHLHTKLRKTSSPDLWTQAGRHDRWIRPWWLLKGILCLEPPKNYACKNVKASTMERNDVCKLREITFNYAAALVDNFNSIRKMLLRADTRDVITVLPDRKIKLKIRNWDSTGPAVGRQDSYSDREDLQQSVFRKAYASRRRWICPLGI